MVRAYRRPGPGPREHGPGRRGGVGSCRSRRPGPRLGVGLHEYASLCIFMHMPRARRHHRIAEILSAGPIPSQERLRELLDAEGLGVTQATLSRDLSELGVVKTAAGYVLPEDAGEVAEAHVAAGTGAGGASDRRDDPEATLRRMLRQEVRGARIARALVILNVRPGWADAVASELDRVRPEGVVGTIAGDDTIFIAVADEDAAARVSGRLDELAGVSPSPSPSPPRPSGRSPRRSR